MKRDMGGLGTTNGWTEGNLGDIGALRVEWLIHQCICVYVYSGWVRMSVYVSLVCVSLWCVVGTRSPVRYRWYSGAARVRSGRQAQ